MRKTTAAEQWHKDAAQRKANKPFARAVRMLKKIKTIPPLIIDIFEHIDGVFRRTHSSCSLKPEQKELIRKASEINNLPEYIKGKL